MFLWGCQLTPLAAGRFVGINQLTVSAPQLEAQDSETRLLIRIQVASQTQAVPGTWTSAQLTLTNATLLSAAQSKTISQAGGNSVSTAFTSLRPGAGYALTVKLYNGATLVAQGSNSSFSLASGANSIAVALSTVGGGGPLTIQAMVGQTLLPDGRQALNWGMSPAGLAVDSANRLYVSDAAGRQIYRLEGAGTLTRIAGTGEKGSSGDGGAAASARFETPGGMAFDSAGNLYIADSGANVIRKVDTAGNISTFAGTGAAGAGADGQSPTAQPLKGPKGVAVDATGNVLITDTGNSRVRFIPKSAGTYFGKSMQAGLIYTIAGTGVFDMQGGQIFPGGGGAATTIPLCNPDAILFGSGGSIYFSDSYSSLVLVVTSAGHMNRAAGQAPYGYTGDGGSALNARMNGVRGIAMDGSGNLYISDASNFRLRRVVSGIISTYAGTGTSGFSGDGGSMSSAQVSGLGAMAFDSAGNLYVVDAARVRKISSGTISTVAGTGTSSFSGDGLVASQAQVYQPQAVTTDAAGNLYVLDLGNLRIRKVDGTTSVITTIAGTGSYGDSGDGGAATSAKFTNPVAIAVDSLGNVYVADSEANRIRKFSVGGTISTAVGTGADSPGANGTPATSCAVAYPYAVALDASDNLYFVDSALSAVRMVPKVGGTYFGVPMAAGQVYTIAGNGSATFSGDGGAATSAGLNYPSGLAFDSSGNLLISDTFNNRIRMVANAGGTYYGQPRVANRIYTVAGDGGTTLLNYPMGIATDASNNLFIADANAHRIRKLDAGGILSTVAGTGTLGYSGDGGAATSAALNSPQGVATTPAGALVIADTNNNRIRKAVP